MSQFTQTHSAIHRALILAICNCFSCCLQLGDRSQIIEEQNKMERGVIKRKRQVGAMEAEAKEFSCHTSASVTGEPEKTARFIK